MGREKRTFELSKEKQKALKNYLDYKKTSVNVKSKMDLYTYFISMFLENSDKNLKSYGEIEIVNFLNDIGKIYSVGTINEVKWMLKSFICWYYEDYSKRFRNLDRILFFQRKEKTYSPEQMLSKEDVELIVKEEKETRWKAFFLLYFYGGFRPKEVCELKWENITFDKDGCFIKIISKKNHKEFQKYVPENVSFYLKKLQNNNSEYVFPTKRTKIKKDGLLLPVGDKPQTRSGVYQHLVPLAKKVLGKHINPYILRHSIATILYNRDNLKDDDVARQMGHSKAMKETYNNLSIEKIRERAKKIWIETEDLPKEKITEIDEMKKLLLLSMELQQKLLSGNMHPQEVIKILNEEKSKLKNPKF